MRAPALALALVALLSASSGLGSPPDPPQTRLVALEAVAFACDHAPDGVCLAYDGVAPGPLLDVMVGDEVEVTLVNRVAETVAALDAPADVKARLAAADVSFHVHGVAVAADMDGVAAHPGTLLAQSVAPPGGSFTYRFRAAFAGPWHYHDHVLGHDGSEGAARGLYGSLVVRDPTEPRPDRTLDLHLHDAGANLGQGLDAQVAAGERVELLVVGLGNTVWDFELADPQGATLARLAVGPGMSERVVVPQAEAGAYRWRAWFALDEHAGEVVAS